jgi:hypothetical protein
VAGKAGMRRSIALPGTAVDRARGTVHRSGADA